MNAKAEQKGRTHTAILDSAARLVRVRGVAGAGVADVMRGAGLTVGGFYAHFASKDALVDEVLARTLEQMRARLFRDLDDKPAGARAAIVLKRYLSTVHRDADAEGCPLPAVIGEIATTAPAHRRALAEQTRAFVDALAALLPGARARARATALGLVALMVGGLSLARAARHAPVRRGDRRRACARPACSRRRRPGEGTMSLRAPKTQRHLEYARALVTGQAPPPPIAKLIGFTMREVDLGRAVVELPAGPQHANPMGTLHGGVIVDAADAAMGTALATTLEDDESFTTVDLHVRYFKPVWTARLVCAATVLKRTRNLCHVECDVLDGGALVARIISTCMILRGDDARGR